MSARLDSSQRLATTLALATLAACYTSPKPNAVPQATSPFGAQATVTLVAGSTATGELLEASDSGVVLLVAGRVAVARAAAMTALHVDGVGDVSYLSGADRRKSLERARLAARFPFGVPREAMAALLAKSAQAAPDDLGPQDDAATARFLERARAGTARYRSQEAAIADGYRRVGVEFPAMGEHWVNLGRIIEDSLVPERPSVLIYVNVAGRPVLAGAAYTDLIAPGAPLPSFPASSGWHEHNGTIDDESLPLAHHGMHRPASAAGSEPEQHLAVLHAWLWLPNPAGVFVTDNWALPLARLALADSTAAPRAALQSLALADGDDYLLLTLRTALHLDPAEEAVADSVLTSQRAAAAREAAAVRDARALDAAAAARLVRLWDETWAALARALPGHRAAMEGLREQL